MNIQPIISAEKMHGLYHDVGSARAIVKSIIGSLRTDSPDISRILRHSADALRKLDLAISEMDLLLESTREWRN